MSTRVEFIVLARGGSPKEAFLNMQHRMRGHESYVMAHHFKLTTREARIRVARMLRDSDTWRQTLEDVVGCIPLKREGVTVDVETGRTLTAMERYLFFGFAQEESDRTPGDRLAEILDAVSE